MRHWWVNQNRTFKHELGGGYLWSPKRKSNGHRNPFYDSMVDVEPGDVIFSFYDTYIKAIGIANDRAVTASRPNEFRKAADSWSQFGWRVPVQFFPTSTPVRPKDHIAELRAYLPSKYSPLQANGNGSESVYLTAVPGPLAKALTRLLRGQVEGAIASWENISVAGYRDDAAVAEINSRTDIPATTRAQLIQARRGQGLYRARLEQIESICRVTGISAREHLRASHMKPWRDSSDQEKLDGNNGLLLAPHVDHLFDRGYISFSDGGQMMIAPTLSRDLLIAWGINAERKAGNFRPEQLLYLKYHRDEIYARQAKASNTTRTRRTARKKA